jgi:hypothetical protein
VYNCHDIRAYGYKRSRILPGLVGIGLVMDENESGSRFFKVVRKPWVMRLHGNPRSTPFNELICV